MDYYELVKIEHENKKLANYPITVRTVMGDANMYVVPASVKKILSYYDQGNTLLYKPRTDIVFMDVTTLQAISWFTNNCPDLERYVVNFANSKRPCGGYKSDKIGSQEEELCRGVPGLYKSLDDSGAYKYGGFDWKSTYLYSYDLFKMRSSTPPYKLYSPTKYQKVDVITIAAPDMRTDRTPILENLQLYNNGYLFNIIFNQIMSMLNAPILAGRDITRGVIILGAFGCGAFRYINDPLYVDKIAKLFRRALITFMNISPVMYHTICFSIPTYASRKNYEIFYNNIANIYNGI